MKQLLFLITCSLALNAFIVSAAAKDSKQLKESTQLTVSQAHIIQPSLKNHQAVATAQSNAQYATTAGRPATQFHYDAEIDTDKVRHQKAQGAAPAVARKPAISKDTLVVELDTAYFCLSSMKTPPGYESIACGEHKFFNPIP